MVLLMLLTDSLALAIEASKTNADLIIMCGVHFMAETAKLMNPQKKSFSSRHEPLDVLYLLQLQVKM